MAQKKQQERNGPKNRKTETIAICDASALLEIRMEHSWKQQQRRSDFAFYKNRFVIDRLLSRSVGHSNDKKLLQGYCVRHTKSRLFLFRTLIVFFFAMASCRKSICFHAIRISGLNQRRWINRRSRATQTTQSQFSYLSILSRGILLLLANLLFLNLFRQFLFSAARNEFE